MTDDRTLLRRMRRGSENAATQLWGRHAPGLLLYARSMLSSGPIEAEDALQQAFCRVFELPPRRVREVHDVRAWLASVVRSIALNAMRGESRESARRRGQSPSDSAAEATCAADPELFHAVQQLAPLHRETIVLRHLSGLTFDQMAIAIGENRSTIASRYRASIYQLRRHLSVELESADPEDDQERTTSTPVSLGEPRHV